MRPGTDGVEIHPPVAPAEGEPLLDKAPPTGSWDPAGEDLRPPASTRSWSPG